MSEIFDEVNEELRREQLRKVWERYSGLILGAAVLIVVGVGGWRGYQYWQAEQAAKSGAAFEAAVTLAEASKATEAQAAFAKIATDGAGGYRMLAQFRSAAETAWPGVLSAPSPGSASPRTSPATDPIDTRYDAHRTPRRGGGHRAGGATF